MLDKFSATDLHPQWTIFLMFPKYEKSFKEGFDKLCFFSSISND